MEEKQDQALMKQEPLGELDINLDAVEEGLRKIKLFQKLVQQNMVKGKDYGTIPGTQKPTLLKPGAEKIAKLMGLSDSYIIIKEVEDYQKPLFAYTVRCELRFFNTKALMSEGLGSCNSFESKYRYRWAWPNEVPTGIDKNTLKKKEFKGKKGQPLTKYRLVNDDIYTQVNTILKMAKKRALVDAALSAGRLSEIFTQDMEDISNGNQSTSAEQAAEFEQDYQMDKQQQPPETLPKRPDPTQQQVECLTAIKDKLIDRAWQAGLIKEHRELTKKERDSFATVVYSTLEKWPDNEADIAVCTKILKPSDFIKKGK